MISQQIDPTATRVELDLLEEVRDKTAVRTVAYKRKVVEYFNRQVKPRFFHTGDLVLRNATEAGHPHTKLGANWEGPYEVIRSVEKGAYILKRHERKTIGQAIEYRTPQTILSVGRTLERFSTFLFVAIKTLQVFPM
ncbi:Ribonuclease H [Abeliophyllum distichum]|uniref:Ribonuclease H n=1 Tax=Abeliophyllum distichum TaxID=126358 RepID=A0ABD1SZ29_9LAMI